MRHDLGAATEAKLAEAFSNGLLISAAVAARVIDSTPKAFRAAVDRGEIGYVQISPSARRYSEMHLRVYIQAHVLGIKPLTARQQPHMKLRGAVSAAVYRMLKTGKGGRRWESLLGYTVDDLRAHLERLFVSGMSWDNYGLDWHVDHRRPISSFQFESAECPDFKKAWALSNLQPLWASENLSKGAKWEAACDAD